MPHRERSAQRADELGPEHLWVEADVTQPRDTEAALPTFQGSRSRLPGPLGANSMGDRNTGADRVA